MKKPSANERIIARALHDMALHDGRESLSWVCLERESQEGWFEDARYLIKRANLLAVSAKTVPNLTKWEITVPSSRKKPQSAFRYFLRRLARGAS